MELIDNVNKTLKDDSLILDFFSGSSTTAHAVMKLNAMDGGNRAFIMVQIPEKIDEKSSAYEAGYSNICEVGKEIIHRAGKKIIAEKGDKKVFNIADGFFIACFDNDVTEETVKAVAQEKTYYAVFRDSSMANDSVATNFEQIFATYSPETVRKVL